MTTTEATILAYNLLIENGLTNWNFSFNKRKKSFGICSYSKKEIQLSSHFFPKMNDDGIKDTLIHEVAHALTQGHNHDYYWRRKCVELGGSGERTSGSDKFENGEADQKELNKSSKYTLTCPCCGNQIAMNRKPKRSYSCGKHGGKYDERYKLILTQNY